MAKLLVIEDDQPLRRAWCIALTKAGFEVSEAGDGREALALVAKQSFDLVVTDLIMPDMEGVETIKALRERRPAMPVIAISGGGRGSPDNYLKLAKYAGAAQVFAKPLALETLCEAVRLQLAQGAAKKPGPPAKE